MPLRWPWYREDAVEKKSVLGTSDELGAFFSFGYSHGTTATSALSLYEKSTAVSVPINMIADAFSVMEPILLIDDRVVEHDVIGFLRNPSPYFSMELFMSNLCRDFLITGETIIVGIGGIGRPPLEMQTISPKELTVVQGTGGLPANYIIAGRTLPGDYLPKRRGASVRYFDGGLRELKMIRNYSTKDNSLLRGQSRLVPASKEARQHILGGDHNISLLERGGRMSLVFHFKADMDDEDFEDTKTRVRDQYGGASNAGEIGVTAGEELEIKDLGMNNRDMDFATLQKIAVKAVALQYRVPLPLVSDERQTLNNYREGKLALYDDAVIPIARVLYGGLGSFLLPRYGLDPSRARITFDADDITSLVSRRNDEMLKRTKMNIETDNELRALINRESYEGGDVVLKASNLMPAGTDMFTEDEDVTLREGTDI